jgi:hypothetical protein
VTLKRVELGENRHGRTETILMLDTVEWADTTTIASASASAAKKKAVRSANFTLLMRCFDHVRDGVAGTERRQVHGYKGPWVDTVGSSRVRETFIGRYPQPTRDDDDNRTPVQKRRAARDRATKAYDRVLATAVRHGHLHSEPERDGDESFLWKA